MDSIYGFFQDVLQAQKLEKVERLTGAEIQQEEVEPEGEAVVDPEGEALRSPGITMVYSPTHFLTFFCKYLGNSPPTGFLVLGVLLTIRQACRR